MDILILLNDAPYATERPYNALRYATALASDGDLTVRLFLMGDGALCAARGHKVPEGMHDIEWMLLRFLAGSRELAVCGTCMDARGITDEQLIEGAHRSTLAELSAWTKLSARVIAF